MARPNGCWPDSEGPTASLIEGESQARSCCRSWEMSRNEPSTPQSRVGTASSRYVYLYPGQARAPPPVVMAAGAVLRYGRC
jgi:hypothetical protein